MYSTWQLFHLLSVQNCFAGEVKLGVDKRVVKTENKCRWMRSKNKKHLHKVFQTALLHMSLYTVTALMLLNWRDECFSSKSFSLICCFCYFHYHSGGLPCPLWKHLLCVFQSFITFFFPTWFCQCLNIGSGSCLSQTASDADSTQGVA